ncbi:hypothetical protein PGAL8A_00089500 [Plasmodium gallinaceum]|uniref:C2 NT-type domain-containing protein n=1 Tax=Plasmodium gallinaceum TaxID=5849 RepID=A0A1J1GPH6_PLAGA|nr:hypothetical protein PGAL8A_00089500 [Plasmodium gallinaceum]CRG93191.1 hypothetical protein PGAL8A_00089500 [Plasmodium gallinaceum]
MEKAKNIMKYLNTSSEKYKFELLVDYINLKYHENIYVTFELVRGTRKILSDEKVLLKNEKAYFKKLIEIKLTLFHKKYNKSYKNKFFLLIFYIITNDEKYIIGKCKIDFSEYININEFYNIKFPIKYNLLNKGFAYVKINCCNLKDKKKTNANSSVPNSLVFPLNSNATNDILRRDKNILDEHSNENNYNHISDNNNNDTCILQPNENYIPYNENNNMNPLNEINIYNDNIEKKYKRNIVNLNKIKSSHTTLNSCNINKNNITNDQTQENSMVSNTNEHCCPHNYSDTSIIYLKKCINDSFKKLKEINNLNSKTISDINKQEIKEDVINKNCSDKNLNPRIINEQYDKNFKNYKENQKEYNDKEKKKEEKIQLSDSNYNTEIHNNDYYKINKKEDESNSNLKVQVLIGNMDKVIKNSHIIRNINSLYLEEEIKSNKEMIYNEFNKEIVDEVDKENFDNIKNPSEDMRDFQFYEELNEISDDKKLDNENINENNELNKTYTELEKCYELLLDKRNKEIKILSNKIFLLKKNSQIKEEKMKKMTIKIIKNYVEFSKRKCKEFIFVINNLKQLLSILNDEECFSDVDGKKNIAINLNDSEIFKKKNIKINDNIIFNQKCEYLYDIECINNKNIIIRNFQKIDYYCNIILKEDTDIYALYNHFEVIDEYINSLFTLKKEEMVNVMEILINIINELIEKQNIPVSLKKKKYNSLINIKGENIKNLNNKWDEKFINMEEIVKEKISKLEKEKNILTQENREINNNFNALEKIPLYPNIISLYEKNISTTSTIKKLTEDVHNLQQIIEELKNSLINDKKYVNINIESNDLIQKIINQYNNENNESEIDEYSYISSKSIYNKNMVYNVKKKKTTNKKNFSNYNIEKNEEEKYHKKVKELENELMNTKLLLAQSETKREEEINEFKKKYIHKKILN